MIAIAAEPESARVSRVDPRLRHEIARLGGADVTACMSCGNCTATCSMSSEGESFPRRVIHLIQVGDREKLADSIEPWLCYFCGDCAESCPRKINPGEMMMAARRWLTGRYDWTGIGRRLYRSRALLLGAMGLVAGLVVALFALFHGPVVTDHVALNTFAPVETIELADWGMAAVLAGLLLSNAWRMTRGILGPERPPLKVLLGETRALFVHFATQKRWRDCPESRSRWLKHLLLVSGYVIMMGLVIIGLRWFQTDEVHPIWYPTRLLGYYATAVILFVSADFFVSRLRAREPIHRSSETSDWTFVALLFLVALTGILVHALRLGGAPIATYVTYVVHLALTAALLIVEVPFGKWSHMLYRPLAMYLEAVRRKTAELKASAET